MNYEIKTTRTYGRANGSLHTHTQAQQPKWVVNNSIVTPTTGQVVSNPLGNTANHSQNAIWDQNGNQYKITHIVQNLNSICHSIETMDIIFNF